jgi:tetratricopeptide (TPR) repeat protein
MRRFAPAALVACAAAVAPAGAQSVTDPLQRCHAYAGPVDRAVALNPQDPWAVSERGLDHLAKANYDLAIRDFDRALELTPMSSWTIAERGAAYLQSGRYDRAIADLTRALELDDGDAWVLYARGLAKRKSGDIAGADADMAAATTLWPNVADAMEKDGLRP